MGTTDSTFGPQALVVPARVTGTEISRLRELAQRGSGTPVGVVIRGRGRRRGAAENLVVELLSSGVATVVVPSIGVLHPSSVARALGVASALMTNGLRVVSLSDGWLSTADPSTLAAAATFLIAEEQRRATRHGSSVVLALARRTGSASVGRPPKDLTVQPQEAQRLVCERGWRKAARAVGTSPATLRRLLTRAGLLAAPARAA